MRVLVVDDSRAMRQYVRGILVDLPGAEVALVDSGFEAFRLLAREMYDLVITDINMPDINGLELIRFIKRTKRHEQTNIVVITTRKKDKTREKLEAMGVNGFLGKPFDPDALTEMISSLGGKGADIDSTEGK